MTPSKPTHLSAKVFIFNALIPVGVLLWVSVLRHKPKRNAKKGDINNKMGYFQHSNVNKSERSQICCGCNVAIQKTQPCQREQHMQMRSNPLQLKAIFSLV